MQRKSRRFPRRLGTDDLRAQAFGGPRSGPSLRPVHCPASGGAPGKRTWIARDEEERAIRPLAPKARVWARGNAPLRHRAERLTLSTRRRPPRRASVSEPERRALSSRAPPSRKCSTSHPRSAGTLPSCPAVRACPLRWAPDGVEKPPGAGHPPARGRVQVSFPIDGDVALLADGGPKAFRSKRSESAREPPGLPALAREAEHRLRLAQALDIDPHRLFEVAVGPPQHLVRLVDFGKAPLEGVAFSKSCDAAHAAADRRRSGEIDRDRVRFFVSKRRERSLLAIHSVLRPRARGPGGPGRKIGFS